jgi:hypothetical protein
MKTLKIPNEVHKELKVYIAKNEKETISDFAGFAILAELKNRGHKFSTKQSKKKV